MFAHSKGPSGAMLSFLCAKSILKTHILTSMSQVYIGQHQWLKEVEAGPSFHAVY